MKLLNLLIIRNEVETLPAGFYAELVVKYWQTSEEFKE